MAPVCDDDQTATPARPKDLRDAEELRRYLASVNPINAQVVAEADAWSVFIPGLPIAAEGVTFDEAITEMLQALREYAADWQAHLHEAPNHRTNEWLVHLVNLSTNDQLRDWLMGERS